MQFRVKLGAMKTAARYRQKPEDAARVQRDPDDDAPRGGAVHSIRRGLRQVIERRINTARHDAGGGS